MNDIWALLHSQIRYSNPEKLKEKLCYYCKEQIKAKEDYIVIFMINLANGGFFVKVMCSTCAKQKDHISVIRADSNLLNQIIDKMKNYFTTKSLINSVRLWQNDEMDFLMKSLLDCNTCGKKNPGNACDGCKVVRYCGENCQKIDWKKSHKLVCPDRVSCFKK